MGKNLASRFAKEVDERFEQVSLAKEIVSEKSSEWSGVETVKVYSMPVAPLSTYNENSSGDVYGPATILERNVQEMKITQKPTFNLKIRRLDKEMDLGLGQNRSQERSGRLHNPEHIRPRHSRIARR